MQHYSALPQAQTHDERCVKLCHKHTQMMKDSSNYATSTHTWMKDSSNYCQYVAEFSRHRIPASTLTAPWEERGRLETIPSRLSKSGDSVPLQPVQTVCLRQPERWTPQKICTHAYAGWLSTHCFADQSIKTSRRSYCNQVSQMKLSKRFADLNPWCTIIIIVNRLTVR